jgi:hypothetical protein
VINNLHIDQKQRFSKVFEGFGPTKSVYEAFSKL